MLGDGINQLFFTLFAEKARKGASKNHLALAFGTAFLFYGLVRF